MKRFLLILLFATASVAAQAQFFSFTQTTNPYFPGGNDSMQHFVWKHIKYPRKARKNKWEGVVVAQLTVNEDGTLSDVKIVRDVQGDCGKEVLKMIKKMPRWKPGTQNGKPIKMIINLPVTFSLPKKIIKPKDYKTQTI